jgi:phosphatidylserine/phosphatidylglycerophosphate/cardiolipin synthase-like enzyme
MENTVEINPYMELIQGKLDWFLLAVILILAVIALAYLKSIRRFQKENTAVKPDSGIRRKEESVEGITVQTGKWPPYFLKEGDVFNFYVGTRAGGKLMSGILNAKKSIRILSPYVSSGEIRVLQKKSDGGLADVAVITSASDDNLKKPWQVQALERLIDCAKKENHEYAYTAVFKSIFFRNDFFHAKLYIIDDKTVFAGSVNFTRKGTKTNHETCLTIKDPGTVKGLCEYYDGLFNTNLDKWEIAELGERIYAFSEKKTAGKKGT